MINKIKNNVFQLYFKEFGSCVYLLLLNGLRVLVDTSSKENKEELLKDLQELDIKPEEVNIILLTHTHWDHTGNLPVFKNAEIYDANNIDKLTLEKIKVIKTPGHTKDSRCFLYQDILFSGDTIFHNGGRGRTDLPGGSEKEILNSIEKLNKIKYKILCPGHVD
ncbi:hypothetical protein A3K73_00830 [Candidatus Pacearchaeota archaeon RBG_13_36_9]|nr:MAG: hypothetical protein A3K73_00830 [Candidatus Pacearchaeota archaeon RBG_13_36_9]